MANSVENPLHGVRVLEIAQYIAGPFAGQQLADYGAEVIKIERPGAGDPFRTYAGGKNVPKYGYNFCAYNRNKKSVVVDLGSPQAAEIIKRLAATVDVVLENFRPGVMDRLGIGYEALKAVNPNIIYCAVAGFSADGPYRTRPAFDSIGQALSGILYLFTDLKNPKVRGPTVVDQVTAMQAATAIIAMLRAKAITGQGGRIDVSMIDAAASFIPDVYAAYTDAGMEVTPDSRASGSQTCMMQCAGDKLVAVQLGGLEKFKDLAEELGCPELADDERFSSVMGRRQNWEELLRLMQPYFKKQPPSHWVARFVERGVPSAEVLGIPEVLQSPEIVQSEMFEKRKHPLAGDMTMIKRSTRINKSRGAVQGFPPILGEHTKLSLREVGYSADEIAKMFESGLIGKA